MLIWSSNKACVVDALAARGDEGRGRPRKAPGSSQTCFDPGVSEWGNPASSLNSFSFAVACNSHSPQQKHAGGTGDSLMMRSSHTEYIGMRGERGELKHLSTRRKRNQPRFPK